ncbi:MAG: cysteine desulfurase-like protein [Acidobacteriota bacterium]
MTRSLKESREDFPALTRTVNGTLLAYFDGPAGTQVPRSVIEAISHYYETSNANTHGAFITSAETDDLIHNVRETVAAFLNASSPATISFGQNMTTLNFALSRALLGMLDDGDEIVVTELDHEANRGPWLNLRQHGIVVREVAMKEDGRLDYDDFRDKVTAKTRLVAMGMASNALGTVNRIEEVREWTRAAGAWLLLDAVHYAPHFSIDVQALDVDFLLCSAYKFYAPHVGILYARPGLLDRIPTERLITQSEAAPERMETGTLNHAALAGVKAGIEYMAGWGEGPSLRTRLVSAMRRIGEHENLLARRYYDALMRMPGVEIAGPDFSDEQRAPTVSVSVKGVDAAEVARRLSEMSIAVWNGDFYARRAVEKLGLVDRGGLVRSGFFLYNTTDEVDRLIEGMKAV